MSMPAEKSRRYSIEEYLRLERDATEKHELRDGDIIAMSGGSENHSLIIANVIGELRDRLKGKPCRVYDSNLRIRVPNSILYTYPDATVICGPSQRDLDDRTGETMINPQVIVEVVSPGSEGWDRGEKFRRFRKIESLREYLLVAQHVAAVDTYFKDPHGAWALAPSDGLQSVALIRSIGIELRLAEFYAGVQLPPDELYP